jgi:putative nucleotidyltransferase with HDIG domain
MLGEAILSSQGRVLLNRGFVLSDRMINRLRELGFTILIIDDEFSKDVIINEVISLERRREAMMTLDILNDGIKAGREVDIVRFKEVVNNIVEDVIFGKNILLSLIDMRSFDTQLFGHSVSVCVLAVVLGKVLHLDRETLYTLAVGAILHDIGMVQLPQDILNKRESFTPEEMTLFKTHTEKGFEILRARGDISLVSAHIAYQHHEVLDGSGYPRGLSGNKLHSLAQLVALADMYDNLVNDGPGHSHVHPNEAVEILMARAGELFSYDLLKAFINHVAVYPNGCTVELNSGDTAIVVNQNKSFPTRPIVRVLQESSSSHDRTYNMIEHLTLFITNVVA